MLFVQFVLLASLLAPSDYCDQWSKDASGTSQCTHWHTANPPSFAVRTTSTTMRTTNATTSGLSLAGLGLPNVGALGDLPLIGVAGGALFLLSKVLKKGGR